MNIKRILITLGLILLFAIICIVSYVGYMVYEHKANYDTTNKPYKEIIGYIDQEKSALNTTYKLCDNGRIYQTYNGAGLNAYVINKKEFRDQLQTSYNSGNFNDSGYLNFRFYVNCEGNAGWFETIEMNLDLEETTLDKNMVKSLFDFTSNSKHWNTLYFKDSSKAYNYYMYVSYRIENGKVTQIIP